MTYVLSVSDRLNDLIDRVFSTCKVLYCSTRLARRARIRLPRRSPTPATEYALPNASCIAARAEARSLRGRGQGHDFHSNWHYGPAGAGGRDVRSGIAADVERNVAQEALAEEENDANAAVFLLLKRQEEAKAVAVEEGRAGARARRSTSPQYQQCWSCGSCRQASHCRAAAAAAAAAAAVAVGHEAKPLAGA
jgi:hypothetical protein